VARANLEDAKLQLSYTEIVAPVSGQIGKKNLEVGNRVQPGQGLLALVQPDVWVTANFKETQLARLKAGQNVRVTIDSIPGRTFAGRVDSLSPASGAQFALLPPDNATGNFTKIVQRIPVKIVLEQKSVSGCENQIAAGMSAVVKVKARE
jgi:membrane fusion protein (multidrug efflux system)